MKSCHNELSRLSARFPVLGDEKEYTYHFANAFLYLTLKSIQQSKIYYNLYKFIDLNHWQLLTSIVIEQNEHAIPLSTRLQAN